MSAWTTEAVEALAPDPASLKSGRGLASRSKWLTLGTNGEAIWGEVQGSGSDPYQTRVELATPAYKCSCPSRKFPCKHALGLLLLYTQNPSALVEGQPPGWVAEWYAARAEKAAKVAEKREARAAAPPDPAKTAQRMEARLDKAVAGLEELDGWLQDMLRQGLANPQVREFSHWDRMARRLVDAQAPGIADWLKRIAGLQAISDDSTRRPVLENLGLMHLMIEAVRRRDALPEGLRSALMQNVGIPIKSEEVLATPPVADEWMVLAVDEQVNEDDIARQETWLAGCASGRTAVVIQHGGGPGQRRFETVGIMGTSFRGSLCFFPGEGGLRALVSERSADPPVAVAGFPGCRSIADAHAQMRAGVVRNPWRMSHPMLIGRATPVYTESQWVLVDGAHGISLENDAANWQLLAVSGGRPVDVFGVYEEAGLRVLSVFGADGFEPIRRRKGAR